MADPTVAELAEKAEARRAELEQSRTSVESADETSAPERVREVPCPGGCGAEVEWTQYRLGDGSRSRWLPKHAPLCDDCQAQADREEADRRERRAREDLERRRRERREQLPELLDGLGVNVREHGHETLETWDATESGPEPVEAAWDFVRNTREAGPYDPVQGLYLQGPTGTGKTLLAVAIVKELLSDPSWPPDAVAYRRSDSLIGEVQATYGSSERSEREVVERLVGARVLVLDDLGTEKVSADVGRVFTEIVSRRALHPTVITSNLSPGEFEGRDVGLQRVGSRLGPRYFRVVEIKGRDRRFD